LADGNYTFSFRRIENLAVMTQQDRDDTVHAHQGHPELVESLSPTNYDLVVTGTDGRTWEFAFADQDLANRVAKAMNHAAELCSGGNQEAF
jgi:hypothetical protein